VGLRLAACALLVACSGGKTRTIEDAKHPATGSDAARADAAVATLPAKAQTGEVSVRVEWAKVPSTVRASPGPTACGAPRQPQVAPTTTWGIPEVLVIVEGAPVAPAEARVRLAECALAPRLAIGGSLVIESAADRPARVTVARRRQAGDLHAKLDDAARMVLLPVAGHAVAVPIEPGGVYELGAEGKDPETAWVVAGGGAITDPSGVVLVKDVPLGAHAVRAWLPPRAGQPARYASGQITVAAGDLAELVLQLEP
jgi:hypothetical protein